LHYFVIENIWSLSKQNTCSLSKQNIQSHVPNEDLQPKTKQCVEDKNKQNWEQHDYGKQRKVISAQKKKTNKENHVMNARKVVEVSKNKEREKNAQSHVRLGQNQPTATPKKRQCSTTNFITDNSMEVNHIKVLLYTAS
jgi:hypothetical protein